MNDMWLLYNELRRMNSPKGNVYLQMMSHNYPGRVELFSSSGDNLGALTEVVRIISPGLDGRPYMTFQIGQSEEGHAGVFDFESLNNFFCMASYVHMSGLRPDLLYDKMNLEIALGGDITYSEKTGLYSFPFWLHNSSVEDFKRTTKGIMEFLAGRKLIEHGQLKE